jgi:hypothetical protein
MNKHGPGWWKHRYGAELRIDEEQNTLDDVRMSDITALRKRLADEIKQRRHWEYETKRMLLAAIFGKEPI